jgi:Icc-related predicted phosphoesterase
MKLVCISDTHGKHEQIRDLPDGDILICAGDFTMRGGFHEITRFNAWLGHIRPKYKEIVVVAGNHEVSLDPKHRRYDPSCQNLITNAHYLENGWVVAEGRTVWGSPYSPAFCGWGFQNHSREDAAAMWASIPDSVDIIVTHGPPHGFGDLLMDGNRVGCPDLFARVMQVRPKAVVSGHIHFSHGIKCFDGITFVNASTCDESYVPANPPIVLDI